MTQTAQESFDPLVDLAGMWTASMAERYLPIPGAAAGKYECWDGRLYMAPCDAAQNSFGAGELIGLLKPGARMAGYRVYGAVNLTFGSIDRWLQPDVTVLTAPDSGVWVPIEHCLLPVEFVSPKSRRRDRLDKPRLYAEHGVPWYMTVELDIERDLAQVVLHRLLEGVYKPVVSAYAGQAFSIEEPFEAHFDPARLLVQ